MADFRKIDATDTSLTFEIYDLDPSYTGSDRVAALYVGNNTYPFDLPGGITTYTCVVRNLLSGYTYDVGMTIAYDGGVNQYGPYSATTYPGSPIVEIEEITADSVTIQLKSLSMQTDGYYLGIAGVYSGWIECDYGSDYNNAFLTVKTISGLMPNFRYEIVAQAYIDMSPDEQHYTSMSYATRVNFTTKPEAPGNLNVNRINRGFIIIWDETDADSYHLEVYSEDLLDSETFENVYPPYVVTGLSPSRGYYIAVRGEYDTGESSELCVSDCIITSPPQFNIQELSYANHSIIASYVSSMSDSSQPVTGVIFQLYNASGVLLSEKDVLVDYSVEGLALVNCTFNNVTEYETYTIKAISYLKVDSMTLYALDRIGNKYYSSKSITANPEEEKPNDFEWSKALRADLPVSGILYTEWNLFVDKVIEVLEYKKENNTPIGSPHYGYPATTSYSELAEKAKMTATDKIMTAKRFNIIRFCIGSHNSTGLTDKVAMLDFVIAAEFIILANKINEWIDMQ